MGTYSAIPSVTMRTSVDISRKSPKASIWIDDSNKIWTFFKECVNFFRENSTKEFKSTNP